MAIDKKINYEKAVVQGGVDNYLGKQPQVQAPRKWKSSPDKPATELAYITEAEKKLILKANIHGGLEGGPNMGPSGIMSLDSFGDVGGGGASGGDTNAGGGAMEGRGFSGRSVAEMNSPRDKAFENRVANEKAALQISERAQANNLGYDERANIANRRYGPLQKYTGERGFLGNLFRGANKYGYTDTYTDGPNQGQVKPGYGGRFFGGLASLMTGIPFVGGALGTAYDYGKGLFGQQKDMTEFNKLGLGGIEPGTLDFDSNAKISDTSFTQETTPSSYTTGSIPFNPGMNTMYGNSMTETEPFGNPNGFTSDLAPEFQGMAVNIGINDAQKSLINQAINNAKLSDTKIPAGIYDQAKELDTKAESGFLGIGKKEADPMTEQEYKNYLVSKGYV
jgi:hypothetical protein